MFTNRYICTAIAVHGLMLAVATFFNKKNSSYQFCQFRFKEFLVPADTVIGEKWYLFIFFFRFEDFMFQTDFSYREWGRFIPSGDYWNHFNSAKPACYVNKKSEAFIRQSASVGYGTGKKINKKINL